MVFDNVNCEEDEENSGDSKEILLALNDSLRNRDIGKWTKPEPPDRKAPVDQPPPSVVQPSEEEIKKEQRILNQAVRARDPLYQPRVPQAASAREIDGAIDNLGNAKAEERKKAADLLEKIGEQALPALNKASKSSDGAIKEAAIRLIDRIEYHSILVPAAAIIDLCSQLEKTKIADNPASYGELIKHFDILDAIDPDKVSKLIARTEDSPAWQNTMALTDLQSIANIMLSTSGEMPRARLDFALNLLDSKNVEKKDIVKAIDQITAAIKEDPGLANHGDLWLAASRAKALESKPFFEAFTKARGDLVQAGFKFNTLKEEEQYLRERMSLIQKKQLPLTNLWSGHYVPILTEERLIENLLKQGNLDGAQLQLKNGNQTLLSRQRYCCQIIDRYIKQGKIDKADQTCKIMESSRKSFHQSIAHRKQGAVMLADDYDQDLCNRLDQVVAIYLEQGRNKEAIAAQQRALAVEKKALDEDWGSPHAGNIPRQISNRLATLGRMLLDDGQFVEAEKCFNEGINMSRDSPAEARCLAGKAALAKKHGNNDDARKYLVGADNVWRTVLRSYQSSNFVFDIDDYQSGKDWLTTMKDLKAVYGNPEKSAPYVEGLSYRISPSEYLEDLNLRISNIETALRKYEASLKSKS